MELYSIILFYIVNIAISMTISAFWILYLFHIVNLESNEMGNCAESKSFQCQTFLKRTNHIVYV